MKVNILVNFSGFAYFCLFQLLSTKVESFGFHSRAIFEVACHFKLIVLQPLRNLTLEIKHHALFHEN